MSRPVRDIFVFAEVSHAIRYRDVDETPQASGQDQLLILA